MVAYFQQTIETIDTGGETPPNIAIFRGNNAQDVAKRATEFLRGIDGNPQWIVDFAASGGGGGDFDLSLIIAPIAAGNFGFPASDEVEFQGFENTDGNTLRDAVNRLLRSSDFTALVGWDAATAAAGGKLGVILMVTPPRLLAAKKARAALAAAAKRAAAPASTGNG